ncbi:hypothetical protein [Prauserella muralis]|uniref:Uncharacterized protein n=1 Tax=Prauserella muralis TaxID=588067 RepID=A0A2V4B9D2_9PSEU|nr:hypothetical protein [Prauserella muralis]PXY31888.1 hypothetical protein BAY60_06040 [Prauserella muralis]TWE13695.1 hypothetical protein FHX69_5822 [Prauserella muralis]
MAPTVLRHTPHDAELVDRTGIIAASQAGRHDALVEDLATGALRRAGLNRSGVASMAAAVLMFVVAATTVFDGQWPSGPVGGGAAREPAVVAAPRAGAGQADSHQDQHPPPVKPRKPAPKPAPAPAAPPEPEPEPDTAVLAESAPQPQAEPVPQAEPETQPRIDVVPETGVDVPRGGAVPDYRHQVREFIEPMIDLYEQQLSRQRSEARSGTGDYSGYSAGSQKWERYWFSTRGW